MPDINAGALGFCEICRKFQPVVLRREYSNFPADREERYLLADHTRKDGVQCPGSGRMPEGVIDAEG